MAKPSSKAMGGGRSKPRLVTPHEPHTERQRRKGGSRLLLIDTSSWIHLLRPSGDAAARARVERALQAGEACWCAVVRLELRNVAGGEREKRVLRDFERLLPAVVEHYSGSEPLSGSFPALYTYAVYACDAQNPLDIGVGAHKPERRLSLYGSFDREPIACCKV